MCNLLSSCMGKALNYCKMLLKMGPKVDTVAVLQPLPCDPFAYKVVVKLVPCITDGNDLGGVFFCGQKEARNPVHVLSQQYTGFMPLCCRTSC